MEQSNLNLSIRVDIKLIPYSSALVTLEHGEYMIKVYRDAKGNEHLAIFPHAEFPSPTFVRIHSECFTGEVLGSLRCDCKNQLALAFQKIAQFGQGVIIYLRQEGRGIGLGNKIKAYQLQNHGLNTVEANEKLGFPAEMRKYNMAAAILKDLGISRILLNTNNPAKISEMRDHGIEVVEVVPSNTEINRHNEDYLRTKKRELGHRIDLS